METSTLMTIIGVCVAIITGIATILALFIGIYAIILQKSLIKRNKHELQEYLEKLLKSTIDDPIIFNKFIDSIINKDEFKNKFLTLIETEIENMLETRETFTQKGDNTIRDKFLKKQEEQGNG